MSKDKLQIGWAVRVMDGTLMFFDLEQRDIASTYCEDGAEPVAIWADAAEMKKHDAVQEDTP